MPPRVDLLKVPDLGPKKAALFESTQLTHWMNWHGQLVQQLSGCRQGKKIAVTHPGRL